MLAAIRELRKKLEGNAGSVDARLIALGLLAVAEAVDNAAPAPEDILQSFDNVERAILAVAGPCPTCDDAPFGRGQ